MKTIKQIFISLAALSAAIVLLSGCSGEQEDVVNGASFDIKSYDDFLWSKYEPDTLKFTINAEFKECGSVARPLVLALCEGNIDGTTVVPTHVAQVYVDGVPVEDNMINVPTCDEGVVHLEIGVVVQDKMLQESETYRWHIKLCDASGLTRVLSKDQNGVVNPVSESDPWMLGMDVCVKNDRVVNKLQFWSTSVILTVFSVLLATILIAQLSVMRFNAIQLTSIFVTTNGSRRGVMNLAPDLEGTTEIVLSAQKQSQGFISRLFQGRKAYVCIPGFPVDLSLLPKRGKKRTSYKPAKSGVFQVRKNGDITTLVYKKGDDLSFEVEMK